MRNLVNCWNTVKLSRLQRSDEISAGVNAENYSVYGNQQPSPEQGKVQRLIVGVSAPKCEAPVKGEDIVWSTLKDVAVATIGFCELSNGVASSEAT